MQVWWQNLCYCARIQAKQLRFTLIALLAIGVCIPHAVIGAVRANALSPRNIAQQNPPPACYHTELDDWAFLEGEWQVRASTRLSAQGPWENTEARAEIKRELRGCLLVERYSGTRQGHPFQAHSLFAWNGNSKKLQQVFGDSEHGMLITYEGVRDGAEIRLETEVQLPDGRRLRLRRVYSKLTKDSFTWESQRSADDGKTWDTSERAAYRRKGNAT